MKLIIGSHVSYTKEEGLLGSVKEAISYGANTFMFYTGAPQNTKRTEINKEKTLDAKKLMKIAGINIEDVIIHAPYIINLANDKDEQKWNFAVNFLKQEIERAKLLGINKIVLHPGSHVGLGTERGLQNISRGLNIVLKEEKGPIICLETMAGKGTELGKTFEEIKNIINNIENKNRVMVCLDTCHLNDAGYDMQKFDEVLDEFDKIIGKEKIGCIHINDSKNKKGAHKDRHENIGLGTIGFSTLNTIIHHKELKNAPKILETPYISIDNGKDRTYPPYKFEIEMIKNKKYDTKLIENIRNFYK
ncbi:MAG: deoxyribonuclease IV [Bacilli bacterium]|nr:deoxyribonuclease IV [Bacilli bacterium]